MSQNPAAAVRKRRAPGIGEHLKEISRLNTQINELSTEIQNFKQLIYSEIDKNKQTSNKASLIDTKESIINEINDIKLKRDVLRDRLRVTRADQGNLRAQVVSIRKSKGLNASEDLAKREDMINWSFISNKMTRIEEERLLEEKLNISKTKNTLCDFVAMEAELAELSAQVGKIVEELKLVESGLNERRSELDELQEAIRNLKLKNDTNPVLKDLNVRINDSRQRMDALISEKRAQHDEIKRKEEEYELVQESIRKQEALETRKKALRSQIDGLKRQLNDIDDKIAERSAHRYDSTYDFIATLTSRIVIPMPVVVQLTQLGVTVPKNAEEAKQCLAAIRAKQSEISGVGKVLASKSVEEKARLASEIEELYAELNSLGPDIAGLPTTTD